MNSRDLILRCLAERSEGLWQVICLDLNLAAQADSLEEAQHKLAEQVMEYIFDAVEGEDRVYAPQLLRRRAPAIYWGKYYLCRASNGINSYFKRAKDMCAFYQTMPMVPARR